MSRIIYIKAFLVLVIVLFGGEFALSLPIFEKLPLKIGDDIFKINKIYSEMQIPCYTQTSNETLTYTCEVTSLIPKEFKIDSTHVYCSYNINTKDTNSLQITSIMLFYSDTAIVNLNNLDESGTSDITINQLALKLQDAFSSLGFPELPQTVHNQNEIKRRRYEIENKTLALVNRTWNLDNNMELQLCIDSDIKWILIYLRKINK
jgi:hypothetical protein